MLGDALALGDWLGLSEADGDRLGEAEADGDCEAEGVTTEGFSSGNGGSLGSLAFGRPGCHCQLERFAHD